ncbi:hypothetical protein BV20DRAFT_11260 [Pilatotrama ljubarskyi]|nr:hypothetical protein BV20DRAFT_11260 [Pilatotrama ljubarskyi]
MSGELSETRGAPVPVFDVLEGPDITDEQLKICAKLFSEHYGVWAPDAPAPLKPGSRVRMSAAKLRQECLSDPENSLIVRCSVGDEHVGHAVVTKWRYKEGYVGWVTQLVVDSRHRRRHIATDMLRELKGRPWMDNVTIMGIASSHPAACNSLCNLFDGDTRNVDLDFMKQHAEAVLTCSPIRYLKGVPLGDAFRDVPRGSYSADTGFYVDHAEPLQILQSYMEGDKWAFGKLLDAHEFLVLVPIPGA